MYLYIIVQSDGSIYQASDSPIGGDRENIKVFVEDWEYFIRNIQSFEYKDEEIRYCEDKGLSSIKARKDIELNEACKSSIIEGFPYTIDGEEYHFPFDIEAQVNFSDGRQLLENDDVDSIGWTVRDSKGEYKRIRIYKKDLNSLSLAIFQHRDYNLTKYRDELLPLVEEARTIEEVNSISWV